MIDKLVNEQCIHKIRVMRSAYVRDSEVNCRNCDGYSFDCDKYKPVKVTGLPIRFGRYYQVVK